MEISKLKHLISNKSQINFMLVFKNVHDFISHQYIDAICALDNLKTLHIDDLSIFNDDTVDIFGGKLDNNLLYIYKVDKFDCTDMSMLRQKHLIIICDDFANNETRDLFENNTITCPQLDNAWINDYLKVKLPGLTTTQRDWLLDITGYNIYRLQHEIDKLNLFPQTKQERIFDFFIKDNVFDDLSSFTIFNFTDAIMTKDLNKLLVILDQIANCDIEPLGVVTILYKNFKNIISIQLGRDISPESTGLTIKQIYALKHRVGYYNATQLKQIFELLTNIDKMLKTGQIDVSNIIDYLLINILL